MEIYISQRFGLHAHMVPVHAGSVAALAGG